MIGIVQKAFSFLALLKGKASAMSALTAATALIAVPVYGSAPLAYTQQDAMAHIVEEPETIYTVTRSPDSEPLVFEASPDEIGALRSGARLEQPFQVTVEYEGTRETVVTTGGTVQEILDQAGIYMGFCEIPSIPLDQEIEDQEHITVHHQKVVREEELVEVPYEVEIIPTSLLAEGKERVLAEGSPGLIAETYAQTLVGGEQVDKRKLDEQCVVEPEPRKVLVGERARPISDLDFGYAMNESGEPVGYTGVLRAERAAGYSAREGAKTASGRDAIVGHVAVDPNVIPYGTKLYIKSTDGNFVYGYAIAADTGTAIRDGLIAVDLFYGSYLESALNEIRSVDIFILD